MHRFDRQLPLLGKAGQERLRKAVVVVVGLGGVGGHVVQQLAYLGVGSLAGIDQDVVEMSNLNRLVGATAEDAEVHTPKTEVMRRLVADVDPGVSFTGLAESVVSARGFALLAEATLVMGCVDREGVRLVLTEFCCAYEIPYIDAASGIVATEGGLEYGGRVATCTSGAHCLVCLDELDTDEAGEDLETAAERDTRDQIYGMDRRLLGPSGPSVVTVNGVVGSLAAMEAMAHLTGLRPTIPLIRYRGSLTDRTPFTIRRGRVHANCYLCQSVRGLGADADVERYLRA